MKSGSLAAMLAIAGLADVGSILRRPAGVYRATPDSKRGRQMNNVAKEAAPDYKLTAAQYAKRREIADWNAAVEARNRAKGKRA